jgi:hypothetical protein
MSENKKEWPFYPIYSGEHKIVRHIDTEFERLESPKGYDTERQYKIQGIAIICAPTGIICTAQVGGIRCAHPSVEGYSIPLIVNTWDYNEELDFDDCEWGCGANQELENKEYKLRYAEEIDKVLSRINEENKYIQCLQFKFDYERVGELMEGWWPVLVQFGFTEFDNLSQEKLEPYKQQFKGYLHFGSCD